MFREQLSLALSRIYYIINVVEKKRYFYKISWTQNLVKEYYVNWQIFIYFCLLILLNLCDSSTLSWETTRLKFILTAVDKVRG